MDGLFNVSAASFKALEKAIKDAASTLSDQSGNVLAVAEDGFNEVDVRRAARVALQCLTGSFVKPDNEVLFVAKPDDAVQDVIDDARAALTRHLRQQMN